MIISNTLKINDWVFVQMFLGKKIIVPLGHNSSKYSNSSMYIKGVALVMKCTVRKLSKKSKLRLFIFSEDVLIVVHH